MTTVAVLGGTGSLGFGLALRFAEAGYQVVIGSRDADRAQRAAARAGDLLPEARVFGTTNSLAAAQAHRLVILTVPYVGQAETLASAAGSMRAGQVVLDTTVWQGLVVQQVASLVPPGVRVVSGLHGISAAAIADLAHVVDEATFLVGDPAAQAVVADHLQVVTGLRVIDAGSLVGAVSS